MATPFIICKGLSHTLAHLFFAHLSRIAIFILLMSDETQKNDLPKVAQT